MPVRSQTARRNGKRPLRRAVVLAVPLLWCGTSTGLAGPSIASAATPTCHGLNATIVGTPRDDTLNGTDGNDVIVGGRGLDTIDGRGGNDVLCGGPTRYKEEEGDPVYQELDGGPGNDVVVGGTGDDYLSGSDGVDRLIGQRGSDYLYDAGQSGATGGHDTMFGGPGNDSLGGGAGANRMFGGPGSDDFSGYNGANLLDGGDGPDFFASGQGDETIRGGRGRDTVDYLAIQQADGSTDSCSDITANLSLGTAHGTGFGTDALQGVENVFSGGGNDVLIGDATPNLFYTGNACGGQPPKDSVDGMGGADSISFDSENLDNGSAPGPVHVDLAAGSAHWSNRDSYPPTPPTVITLQSVENVTGTEYRDDILGDAHANALVGGTSSYDAADRIEGRGGPDQLSGSGGSDALYGGPGTDQLRGGRGADSLYGQVGNDTLYGQRNNDHLNGGTGLNRNIGGAGVDTCRNPRHGLRTVSCERYAGTQAGQGTACCCGSGTPCGDSPECVTLCRLYLPPLGSVTVKTAS
jgi:Ca2+-binding RTX toxin-like protein